MKMILVTLVAFISINSFAQGNNPNHSGLYLSAADFLANKLTYEIDCKTDAHKIILHDFFEKSHLDVIHHGEKFTVNKSEVYAFRDCENQLFRFYKNQELLIREINEIYIYVITKPIPKGKRVITKEEYFFSVGATGAVQLLTKNNLKNAYPTNQKFHVLLDSSFKDDVDVSMYETYHKMHKINHLLNESYK